MPEPLLDLYGIAALREEHRGARVSEGMEADPGDARLFGGRVEHPALDVRVHDRRAALSLLNSNMTMPTAPSNAGSGSTLAVLLAKAAPNGLPCPEGAEQLFEKPSPTRAEVEKVRRRFERLVKDGRAAAQNDSRERCLTLL